MSKNTIIAPSVLAADFANLQRDIEMINNSEADWFHIDIMDGVFVPNISFGAEVVAAMRSHSKLVFDCHLMVSNPENHIETFARAGADILTIHAEATVHLHGTLQKIRDAGMKVGVVINPGTPLVTIEPVLNLVDQVLLMTVNPGFGGQAYIPEVAEKIEALVKLREAKGLNFDIEVDGGIDDKTIHSAKNAGANVFVAGSYLFKGDLDANVAKLKAALHD